MDTRYFHSPEDNFRVLSLRARYTFKTDSSISFDLSHESGGTVELLGWVDIHHPCDGEKAAQMRLRLPSEYLGPEDVTTLKRMKDIVFQQIGIPREETFSAVFVFSDIEIELVDGLPPGAQGQ